jgi:beta-propeller repeat-containing protein
VSFAIGPYDSTRPLVIDPVVLGYSTYLGGALGDIGLGIAVDATGNAYVTGWTQSTNFPTTPGAFDTTYNGGFRDAFVAKLSADGTTLIYGTYLGGSSDDYAYGRIAVDFAGRYVTGVTYSTDFPTTPGAFDTTYNGVEYWDVFAAKLSASGLCVIPRCKQFTSGMRPTTCGTGQADSRGRMVRAL